MNNDHTAVARRLAAKGHANNDLNRLVNLGMVSGDGDCKNTQLQSVSHKQRIIVVIKQTQNVDCPLKIVHLKDPHHDSNKLYGVIKALPLRELQRFELERLGIEERDLDYGPSANKQTQEKFCNTLKAIECVGGAWLNDTEAFSPSWPQGSRVALAARILNGSHEFAFVVFTAEEVFPNVNEAISVSRFTRLLESVPEAKLLFQGADLIVPVVMPIRIANSNNVRFFG